MSKDNGILESDIHRVYKLVEQFQRFFHQPLNYKEVEQVQRFVKANYHELHNLYHHVIPQWLSSEDEFEQRNERLSRDKLLETEIRRVYELFGRVLNLFHERSHYEDLDRVTRFAEDNYPEIRDLYYDVVWSWLPKEIRWEILDS